MKSGYMTRKERILGTTYEFEVYKFMGVKKTNNFKKAEVDLSDKGTPVYNLWKLLKIIEKEHNVNFWDVRGALTNFDQWCDKKGYGERDNRGNVRTHSKLWFTEYQKDIKNGDWECPPYYCFIDEFTDFEPAFLLEYSKENYWLNTQHFLKFVSDKDQAQFGKHDYRYHLGMLLKRLFGNGLYLNATIIY
jgi:hypothetical protein